MLHQELAPQSNSSTATISDVLLLFDLWLTSFGLVYDVTEVADVKMGLVYPLKLQEPITLHYTPMLWPSAKQL